LRLLQRVTCRGRWRLSPEPLSSAFLQFISSFFTHPQRPLHPKNPRTDLEQLRLLPSRSQIPPNSHNLSPHRHLLHPPRLHRRPRAQLSFRAERGICFSFTPGHRLTERNPRPIVLTTSHHHTLGAQLMKRRVLTHTGTHSSDLRISSIIRSTSRALRLT
jgi:hypothetical protein